MDRALQVREILLTRGLTLYNVSRKSAEIFGRFSQFYVPHNLYYDLAHTLSIPTIFQILALSHITGYQLPDWLAVFGFDLDAISRLQLGIPRQQTAILDSTVYDTYAWIPWFVERPRAGPVPAIAPLGQFLALAEPRRATEILAQSRRRFLYGRVGKEDVHALPGFAPGTIVRADTQRAQELLSDPKAKAEKPFFLVEHEFGYNCSQLTLLAKDRVLMYSQQHPCAQRELRLGGEARILGVIDAEIRPVGNHSNAGLMRSPTALEKPRLPAAPNRQSNLKVLLRDSRVRAGLSFREASAVSRSIAGTLSDELYFAAASTLSDYETLAAPPRHIQKIITLCVVYGLEFRQFLRASGLPLEKEGHNPMPDELAGRPVPNPLHGPRMTSEDEHRREYPSFLDSLLEQWEEIPLFLLHSLNEITGNKNFRLADVFWVGGDKAPIHPLLVNATLVAVNRRVKKPAPSPTNSFCHQPLYLLLKRDGAYLCGRCVLRQGNLVVPSYPGGRFVTQHYRNGVDAEVVGQVTAILRRVL